MRLFHYGSYFVHKDNLLNMQHDCITSNFKPNGLWVTMDCPDSWKDWCESESFRLEALTNKTEIILKENAKILYLTSDLDIIKLLRKYPPKKDISFSRYFQYPNWGQISQEYDGIIICPYSWECRSRDDTFWYYSWDCASGCIWNTECIEETTPVFEKMKVETK